MTNCNWPDCEGHDLNPQDLVEGWCCHTEIQITPALIRELEALKAKKEAENG